LEKLTMGRAPRITLALAFGLFLFGCGNDDEAGGEAGTPAENISEAEPEGVGGTSNQ
jgi:hypothetical protein